jgi:hypothetical protein
MTALSWNLPGYTVGELIGTGSSGQVWRARQLSSGRAVALKRIAVTDPAAYRDAQGEAALLSNLAHPHLIRLHELHVVEGAVVLVVDLAAGGSLTALLARRGRLSAGEVVTVLAPIAAALAYAHTEGVIHGDVAPGNIVLTADGRPLLSDLGVARIIGDQAAVRTTAGYVDPAVAAGALPSPASDVFMLGAVAFHALTGSTLWRGTDVAATLAAAANAGRAGNDDPGVDRSARLAELPPALADVLERALAIQPAQRCTAAELALDLGHAAPPTPIELGIGRAPVETSGPRVGGPRHARASDPVGGLERPAFERPERGRAGAISTLDPAAIRAIRAARQPRPGRWSSRPAGAFRTGSRRAAAFGAGLLVLVGAVLVAHAASAPRRAAAGRPPGPTITAAPASPPPSSPPPVFDAAAARAVLIRLDGLRERAFAERAAGLLRQVYEPGPLLTQDTQLLTRLVRPGCRLTGVRTSYSGIGIEASTRLHPVIVTTATLAPSELSCAAGQSGGALGAGPTRLRIELAASGGSYRVARQQTLSLP